MFNNRQRFFDKQVHMREWKDAMSGKNEENVVGMLESLEYKLNEDFIRQHPIGQKFVLDFAFVPLKLAIEIDGISHEKKLMKRSDKKRDRFLYDNNWVVIRISDKNLFGFKKSFYKHLIREVVEARRDQYNGGHLYQIDVPEFVEEDY